MPYNNSNNFIKIQPPKARIKAIPQSARESIPLALWGIASILALGGALSMFTTTVVNIAFSTISVQLNTSLDKTQWIATGYLVSLAAMAPLSGWASRRYGSSKLWLVCTVLFIIFSLSSAFSTSIEFLTFFRVLQGISAGLLVPAGQILFITVVGSKDLGRMIALLSIPAYLAPIAGIIFGSILTNDLGWPWLFLVNIPISLLSFFLGFYWFPNEDVIYLQRLDWLNLTLVTLSLPLLVYGTVDFGRSGGRLSTFESFVFFLGILLFIVFIINSWYSSEPLLNLKLFKSRSFFSVAVIIFCMGFVLFSAMVILPMYYLEVRHETLMMTGLLTSPLALGTVVGLPLAGRLTDCTFGARLAFFGLIITVISTLPLSFLTETDSYFWISLIQIIRGLGIGFTTTPIFTIGLTLVSQSQISHITPILNMLHRLGGSFGTATMTAIVAFQLAFILPKSAILSEAIAYTHWYLSLVILLILTPSLILMKLELHNDKSFVA